MTQAEVAEISGLSASFVRMVETGRSDISLSRLLRWSAIFGLSIGEVASQPTSSGPVQVTSSTDWVRLPSDDDGVDFYLVSPGRHEIEPGIFILAPGAAMAGHLQHEGEEVLLVLEGEVRLHVADTISVLRTGQAAYFASHHPHKLENHSDVLPARVLSTSTHPRREASAAETTPSRRRQRRQSTSTAQDNGQAGNQITGPTAPETR